MRKLLLAERTPFFCLAEVEPQVLKDILISTGGLFRGLYDTIQRETSGALLFIYNASQGRCAAVPTTLFGWLQLLNVSKRQVIVVHGIAKNATSGLGGS